MKKNIWKPVGIITLVMVIGLGLAGCPTDSDDDDDGGGNIATIIIKNQSGASVTVELEDAWESADGSKILSGLETKTIVASAEGTWSLECSGDRAWVDITAGTYPWYLYDVKAGATATFTWDGSKLAD
jgi:hypothetical protein